MTVILVTTIQRWIGLSTDTKPSSNIKVGSTFYETNTGKGWIWDGDIWTEDLSMIHAVNQALNN